MEGKNILITGASRGIGKAVAEYLYRQGAGVILVARDGEKLKTLSQKLGERSFWYAYDLTDLEHIEDIFAYCQEKHVKLDGMVHCAGVNRDMPIRTNDVNAMKEVFAINCMSFIELGKFFSKKKYSADGGSIVAVSSNATQCIAAGMSTYTSSKAALEAAVSVLAKEIMKRRMRANAILPSCVNTDMVREAPFLTGEAIERNQPLGVIEPVQIAYLAEFLLSEKSKHITGAKIPVTSGNFFV